MEEALFLAKFASLVTIVHRRDKLRASQIMQKRARKNPKIKFIFNTQVNAILGKDKVEQISLLTDGKKHWQLKTDGVFVAIGHLPNSQKLPGLELDAKGFVKRKEVMVNGLLKYSSATNIAGVFTAGDVHDYRYRQAITAAAFGCMAALDVEKYLEENF